MKALVKKAFSVALVLAGLSLVAKLVAPRMQSIDWEKKFESMPDNAPPKWMFRNISAIRENTDRILGMLEQEQGSARSTTRLASESGAQQRGSVSPA